MTGTTPAFGPREFGQNLRRLRLERSLTQEQVAEQAAVSPRYVALIEAGDRNPTLSVIVGLSEALGIQPARLFVGPPTATPERREGTRLQTKNDATRRAALRAKDRPV